MPAGPPWRSLALSAQWALAAGPQWTLSNAGPETRLSLKADKPVSPLVWPEIIVLCRDRKPEVGLVVGMLESRPTVRFDREPAMTPRLHNRTAFGGWLSNSRKVVEPGTQYFDKPVDTIATLQRHQSMLLRIVPAGGRMQQTTFTLAGLSTRLAAFEQACGFDQPLPRPSAIPETGEVAAAEVSPTPPPANTQPAVETIGNWTVNRSTSALDDLPIVILSLAPTTGPIGTPPRTATLVLRCREHTLAAFLSFDWGIFGGGSLAVQASVDAGPTKERWLRRSTDGRAFFFLEEFQFLKRLLASRELRLKFGPTKRTKYDTWMPEGEAVYELNGLDKASAPLLAACPVDLTRVKIKDGLGPTP